MSIEIISNLRLWIYRLIAILVIPAIVLICIEGGLRISGAGHPVNFTTDCTVDGQEYLCENPRFIEQFFPIEIARQPVSFAYPEEKPAETFRIFILGASAAQGDPEQSYGFSRILKVLLRERFPAINFEVINTAITATNSHVVLPIAKEVSQHQPDMAIIYLGNNEVVGPFGAGTIFSQLSPNLSLIRAGINIKTTRIGQVINSFIRKIGESKAPKKWQGMEMFLGNQVRSDSAALETVYLHYQDNLLDIIQTFRKKNIPVVVSTVGSNLKDFPPLASQHRPSLKTEEFKLWDESFKQGLDQFHAGEFKEALKSFLDAEQIDESHAELQYLIGQSQLKSGDYLAARERLVRARDLDTLRFRADSRINGIIRNVVTKASDNGVFLLDTVRQFDEQSPQQIQGKEHYYEHVHLTFHGNYLLARAVAEKVLMSLAEEQTDVGQQLDFLNEEDCSNLLALSQFDQQRIEEDLIQRLERPPFINQWGHAERLAKLKSGHAELKTSLTSEVLAATDSLYLRALQSSMNDPWLHYNYAVFLKDQKKPAASIVQFQTFVKMLPRSYKGHHELAVLLAGSGRFEEALPHYQLALNLIHVTATRTELRMLKAYALARLGRYEETMATYKEALKEDESSAVNVHHAMAKLRIKTGQLTEARVHLEKAISKNKNEEQIPDIYFNYGHVLNQLKQNKQSVFAYNKAIQAYEKTLQTADGEEKEILLYVIGRSYFEIGEVEKGSQYLQRALNLNPAVLDYHLTLITALARKGHKNEALAFTDKALQVMNGFKRPNAIESLKTIRHQVERK